MQLQGHLQGFSKGYMHSERSLEPEATGNTSLELKGFEKYVSRETHNYIRVSAHSIRETSMSYD